MPRCPRMKGKATSTPSGCYPVSLKTLGLPMSVFSVEMNDCEDADLVATKSVKDSVGKMPSDRVANIAMKNLILLRIGLYPLQGRIDFRDELATEALTLPFVPFGGTSNVRFGPTPEEQLECRRSRRISAFAFAHGSTSSGFCSSSARRSSNRRRCDSDSGRRLTSSAISSHSSWTRRICSSCERSRNWVTKVSVLIWPPVCLSLPRGRSVRAPTGITLS